METDNVRGGVTGTVVPLHDGPRSPGWIVAENGCHIWIGSRNGWGYGMVSRGGRWVMAHRVRYEREVGPIPAGMQLDHFACDNKSCCNPAHVRPVSQRENVLRGTARSALQAARTHCIRGHELTGDNLLAWGLRQGRRKCRTCSRLRDTLRREPSS